MKIAVTYDNGNVFQHFGHTEFFKIFNIENNEIESSAILNANGYGHGALAQFLKMNSVDVLICGGIGGGAQTALANAGIKLFGGVSGDADKAAADYLKGELQFNADVHCNHHSDGHNCSDHNCSEHKCSE